jgi:hypothetical protein
MNFDTVINIIMISFQLKNSNKINLSFEVKNISKFYNIITEKAVAALFYFHDFLFLYKYINILIYIFARRIIKVCSKVHKMIYRII